MRSDREPTEDLLSERERQVLQALVDAHIATAEPVGSKALAQITDIGVSPATIRNVLAALHDKGLIEQPHTSAGRVPTDRGLRYYVDCLLQVQAPDDDARGEIARIGEAVRETTKVLTRLSRYTTILVLPSGGDSARLRHVDLVRLRDTAVLLILVTADGKVQNRLLEWPPGLSDNLDALANRVNELVAGRTLDEATAALSQNLAAHERELTALQTVLAGLKRTEEPEVHVDGTAHLLEAANLERTRDLLALLEEGSRVKQVLEEASRAPGIRIFIGEENPSSALYERGLVTAPVGPGGTLGVLGVIGPRHLDYARVVPLVDLTAQVVTRTLQG